MQSGILQKKLKQSIDSEEKISPLVSLQRRIRDKHALTKVHEKTGINIRKQSHQNLMALYQRLKHGTGLPHEAKESISHEKEKTHHALTPQELSLYKKLINKPIYINHATEAEQAILQSGKFYSTMQLKALGINAIHRTSDNYGADYFVYFSYGYAEKMNTVNFMEASNFFVINLDELARREPLHYSSFWTAGHFFSYDAQQDSSPLVVQYHDSRLQINLNYRSVEKLFPQMMRHFHFHSAYQPVTITLKREEEISCGRHIKAYHTLRLIEYLRFFPAIIRQHILHNQDDKQLADLFDSLFAPGKTEIHIPYQQSSQNSYTQLVVRKDQLLHKELEASIKSGDYEALQSYLIQAPNAFFYRYAYNEFSNLTLLNIAVLENQHAMVKLLISMGFDPGHNYTLCDLSFLGKNTTDSLVDAIKKKDSHLIQLLLDPRSSAANKLTFMFSVVVNEEHLCTAIAYDLSLDVFDYLLKQYLLNDRSLIAPLRLAIYYENFAIMERLRVAGVNIHETTEALRSIYYKTIMPSDTQKGSALMVAAQLGRVNSVKYFIQQGANINARYMPPFMKKFSGYGRPILSSVMHTIHRLVHDEYKLDVDKNLYRPMAQASVKDYVEIMALLLKAGANIMPVNAKDYYTSPLYYFNYFKDYSIFPSEIISHFQQAKLPPEPKRSHEFIRGYQSYGLIVANDAKDEPALFLGSKNITLINVEKTMQQFVGNPVLEENLVKEHWAIPGGGLHIGRHDTLRDSLIFHTAFQTGIDLTIQPCDTNTHHFELGKAEFEVDIVKLKNPIHQIKHFKQTLDHSGIYDSYQLVDPMIRLHNLHWVPLKHIRIELVPYENITFPVFFYQEKPLPLIATTQLMQLFNINLPQIDEINRIAIYLHANKMEVLRDAILKDNVDVLRALHVMRFTDVFNFNSLMNACFDHQSVKIISYLLTLGYQLDEKKLISIIDPTCFHEEKPIPTPLTNLNVFITSESPMAATNETGTGDVDYANTLYTQLKARAGDTVKYVNQNTKQEFSYRKGQQIIHMIVNPPLTGCAIDLDWLKLSLFQKNSLVVTAIDFAKYSDPKDKTKIFDYLSLANHAIFLDELDKKACIEYARSTNKLSKAIETASVINVPPTIHPNHITTQKTGSNIMCFGMLRVGKGFAHILKLAELISQSTDEKIKHKKVYIVGTVQRMMTRYSNSGHDATLYKILCAMYPSEQHKFYNKSPAELKDIANTLDESKSVLPIRLFLDVPEEKLPTLFADCEYGFNPAYRGATLRNSSISTMLAYHCITYSHVSHCTPSLLLNGGAHEKAMVLFPDDDYAQYANRVLQDITARENSFTNINEATRTQIQHLVNEELSLEKIVLKHVAVYQSLRTSAYNLFWQKKNERDAMQIQSHSISLSRL
jgi:ankyrin repeat protein